MTDPTVRKRVRTLTTKLIASPVLPVLGWTKAVETIVAGGPTLAWLAYAVVVTAAWVFADTLQEITDEAADAVEEATE